MEALGVKLGIADGVFVCVRQPRIGLDMPAERVDRQSERGENDGNLPDEQLSAADRAVIGMARVPREFVWREISVVAECACGDEVGFVAALMHPCLVSLCKPFGVESVPAYG